MKEILLTKGQVALVDDEDFDWLSQYTWRAFWDWHSKSYYARTYEKGKTHADRRELRMHRLILGLEPGDKRHGDHIDQNTLNNQRSNLRIASVSENNRNRRTPRNNKSGYKGLEPVRNGWYVRFKTNGVRTNYGFFRDKDEAIKCLIAARMQDHGEFARIV